jgi:hypothetical protein
MRFPRVLVPVAILISFLSALGQEAAKPTPSMNPFTRLTAARTIFIKNGGGGEIPFNVIESSMEGWGRYQIVRSADEADLILEVTSPTDTGGGVSISSSTKPDRNSGKPEQSTSTSREISPSGGPVKIVVYDAHSKAALWSGMEQAKSAMRQKQREDNLVQAAEKVFTKFHDRIEPPPLPSK